jgi:hypothetical protein
VKELFCEKQNLLLFCYQHKFNRVLLSYQG